MITALFSSRTDASGCVSGSAPLHAQLYAAGQSARERDVTNDAATRPSLLDLFALVSSIPWTRIR